MKGNGDKDLMPYVLIWIIIGVMIFFIFATAVYANPQDDGFIPMEATAYCSGTTCSTGVSVRVGIVASKPEWYGKVAMIYRNNNGELGEFIGYYEVLDTGSERIKNGEVIDIYNPSEPWCKQFGRQDVLVKLVDGDG